MAYRVKMSRGERAKQFMPFAALKGYEKALRQKEQMLCGKDGQSKNKRASDLDEK